MDHIVDENTCSIALINYYYSMIIHLKQFFIYIYKIQIKFCISDIFNISWVKLNFCNFLYVTISTNFKSNQRTIFDENLIDEKLFIAIFHSCMYTNILHSFLRIQ